MRATDALLATTTQPETIAATCSLCAIVVDGIVLTAAAAPSHSGDDKICVHPSACVDAGPKQVHEIDPAARSPRYPANANAHASTHTSAADSSLSPATADSSALNSVTTTARASLRAWRGSPICVIVPVSEAVDPSLAVAPWRSRPYAINV
jgi:hypothetical protein